VLRVALLSFWHVHAKDYLRQARDSASVGDEVEVVACWDADPVRGAERAAEEGLVFEPDLDVLLARNDVDAVINTTPTSDHVDVLVRVAEAGKHIFTEKVVAATLAEHDQIAAAVEQSGVIMTVSLPRLSDPYTAAIDQVLADGALGRVTYARSRLSHGGAVDNWLPDHFYDPAVTCGGAMIDLGCHPMYLTARFLGGLPASLTATYAAVTGRDVEDSAVTVLSYGNEAIGVVEAGFVNRVNPFELELHGTDGSLFFGTPDARLLLRRTGEDGYTEIPLPERAPLPFVQWVQAIQTNTPTVDNLRHARRLTILMEASNRAATSGERVTIDAEDR